MGRRLAFLACLTAATLLGAPGSACLNDSESTSTEHQFTSRYSLAANNPRATWNWIGLAICVVSGGLVAGCVVLTWKLAHEQQGPVRERTRR